MLETGKIINNSRISGDYFKVEFLAPGICRGVRPGQFVHVQIAELRDRILRRPFSICDTGENGVLTVVYKIVGEGTLALSRLQSGTACSLLGPQGLPFSFPKRSRIPVIVAGGYGAAATYLLAKQSPVKGFILIGAKSQNDLILIDEFRKTGFQIKTATEDGSFGYKGLATDLLDSAIKTKSVSKPVFYGCGPQGMLASMGKMLLARHLEGELSLDHLMCCGVGACFACVVKVKDKKSSDGWRYARTCREGPVFSVNKLMFD